MSDASAMHRALERLWAHLYQPFEEARFTRRSGLAVVLFPSVAVPQFNGVWVREDSEAAVAALPAALAEVESAGVRAWVQTRGEQARAREAARAIGLTETETLPGMVVRPGELLEARADVEIGLVADDEVEETNELLARSFRAPHELFDHLGRLLLTLEGVSWYVGRAGGRIVSTAMGVSVAGATGIFNVATPPEQRGRGYGAALTARAVRDGFEAGSQLAFLQSSEAGHDVYRRLGFRDVVEYILLTRPESP